MTASGPPLQVCISFDFDAMSVWMQNFEQASPTPISRGEFGARVAVPRLLDLLEREAVAATFFIPGHTIDTFPDLCRSIAARGHEVGHHGYLHESPVDLDEAAERAVLERGLETIERQLGGYRPRGYRSPAFDLSPASTRLLLEHGFEYDSSMMAQDFEPYWCRSGDEPRREEAFRFGPELELVELPVSWSLDDFPQLEFAFSPAAVFYGSNNPAQLRERWLEELDFAAEEVPGGVFTITFHPQTIGRGARIRIVEAIIARAREHGAEFVSCAEAASRWARSADPPGDGQPRLPSPTNRSDN